MMQQNLGVTDEDYGFDEVPVAEVALVGQDLGLLTPSERAAIQAYAFNGFEQVNQALWGVTPMTTSLARRIDTIRSGLRKYPLPMMVRVTREAAAQTFGIVDEESAHALAYREFTHRVEAFCRPAVVPCRRDRHDTPTR